MTFVNILVMCCNYYTWSEEKKDENGTEYPIMQTCIPLLFFFTSLRWFGVKMKIPLALHVLPSPRLLCR